MRSRLVVALEGHERALDWCVAAEYAGSALLVVHL